MPRIKAGSITLHYERSGRGDPLVLIMGFGTGGVLWGSEIVRDLAERFEVIVPDNRGTGQSEKIDEPIAIATMADDVANLLDALGINHANVFGVSMGGFIAQEFALRHPAKLRSLILGCTNCGGDQAVPAPPEVVALLMPVKGTPPRQAVQNTFAAMVTPETLARETAFLEEMAQRMLAHATPVFVFRRQMEAIGRFDACSRLHAIAAPTLVITGDRDRLVPPRNAEIIAAAIPGARLAIIPGAAHNFFWEARAETVQLVTDFLRPTPRP